MNEELQAANKILVALARQQGGVISVTEEELRDADIADLTIYKLENMPGTWFIKVSDE